MPNDLAPETELLRRTARRCLPGPAPDDDLAPLLARVNWSHLLWIGRHRNGLSFLADVLKAPAFEPLCPADVRAQLEGTARTNTMKALTRDRELCLLQDRFDHHGIAAITLDRSILRPRLELRETDGSIDLLLRRKDGAHAREILTEAGYVLGHDPLRLNIRNRSHLNLLFNLAPGNPVAKLHRPAAWAAAQPFPMGGRNLLVLAPAHRLSHLCWQGCRNGWPGLGGQFDVAALALAQPASDWPTLLDQAAVVGTEAAVLLGVAASLQAFGLPAPEAVARRLERRPGLARAVARIGPSPSGPPSRWRARLGRLRTRVALHSTWKGKAHEIWWQARATFGPRQALPEADSELSYLGRFSPTPPKTAEAMLRLAETTSADVVYDLGCGNGRLVNTAAKLFSARAVGIDIDPKRIEEATAAAAGLANPPTFILRDLMEVNLHDATVVCLYLQGFTYPRLREKLEREVAPGTRIVSHNFIFPDWPPEKTEIIRNGPANVSHIYLWRINPGSG